MLQQQLQQEMMRQQQLIRRITPREVEKDNDKEFDQLNSSRNTSDQMATDLISTSIGWQKLSWTKRKKLLRSVISSRSTQWAEPPAGPVQDIGKTPDTVQSADYHQTHDSGRRQPNLTANWERAVK